MPDEDDRDDRLAIELSLLESMYPEQIKHHVKAGELSYKDDQGSFTLRLSNGYLRESLPEVLAARAGRTDLREPLKAAIVSQCRTGEEILDSIIMAFQEVVQQTQTLEESEAHPTRVDENDEELASPKRATVIVYLHHLLNTNKRKRCLSPPPSVSGVTKPGYPGVLVYSGPLNAVHEHVNELKALNWQAFQVRLEVEEEWTFKHGVGVIEVEGMGEVVTEVEEGSGRSTTEDASKQRKLEFLEAMKMKG
nr:rwd domain-containing protein 2b [Quercus suber]